MIKFASSLILLAACFWWVVEQWARRALGLELHDNCFTWATRNWSYQSGDGVLIHKSLGGWFPHVVVVKSAQSRDVVEFVEFVPNNRVPLVSPPRKFDGYVRATELEKKKPHV